VAQWPSFVFWVQPSVAVGVRAIFFRFAAVDRPSQVTPFVEGELFRLAGRAGAFDGVARQAIFHLPWGVAMFNFFGDVGRPLAGFFFFFQCPQNALFLWRSLPETSG